MRALALLLALLLAVPAAARDLRPLTGGTFDAARLRFLATHPAEARPDGTWLVVALHGCKQEAGDYARKSGWTDLADTRPLAVLAPQFTGRWSNLNRCWEWWEEDEALARQGSVSGALIEAIRAYRRALGPGPTFVTGLSAGGAMAQVLVANAPDLFAAQAVVAGVPFGCSLFAAGYDTSCKDDGSCRLPLRHMLDPFPYPRFTEAASCMEHGYGASPEQWRAKLPGRGPWPPVLIVQGARDPTVDCANARETAQQWAAAQDAETPRPACDPSLPVFRDGVAHARSDKDGRPAVEVLTIRDLGHAQPVTAGCGTPDPDDYFAEAPICAAAEAARFFGEVVD
ncbi:MAG: PHB depolymerase family esterase [Pseudomonadota bacterium]